MTIRLYKPKHRRAVSTDRLRYGYAASTPYDVQNDARCHNVGSKRMCTDHCPRHNAATYADMYARHATDSISRGPISPVTGERVW